MWGEVVVMHSALKSRITICIAIWEIFHVFSFPQVHYTNASKQDHVFLTGGATVLHY